MSTRDLAIGATMGSALMFMLDPDRGRRRRALVRDKATWAARKTRDGLDATRRDIANRASGVVASARRRWSSGPADDGRLAARVRAALGRVCSHPGAIAVEAHDGHVTLRGPVLASEVSGIIKSVAAVPAVMEVTDQLEPHDQADRVPSLQGSGRTIGSAFDPRPRTWAPATKVVVSTTLLTAGVWMAVAARRAAQGGAFIHHESDGHDGGYADAAM